MDFKIFEIDIVGLSPKDASEYVHNRAIELLDTEYGVKGGILAKHASGKPYFANAADIKLSISHSRERAVIVFARDEVGADIQRIGKVSDSLVGKYYQAAERKYFDERGDMCPDEESKRIAIWTRKEAYAKLTGEGLTKENLIRDTVSDSRCEYETFRSGDYFISVCMARK